MKTGANLSYGCSEDDCDRDMDALPQVYATWKAILSNSVWN